MQEQALLVGLLLCVASLTGSQLPEGFKVMGGGGQVRKSSRRIAPHRVMTRTLHYLQLSCRRYHLL
jgi:hypothetical protein